jgi:polyisoprenoid-binding protein YceI
VRTSTSDFFEVEKYPTMRYHSSGIRRDGDDLVLDGELTLKLEIEEARQLDA